MRSTLTATQGKCKLIGNVKGKKNWFYKLGERARSGERDYRYFKITAYDAVKEGILKLEEVEQAKRDLPKHVFDELYLAEPADDKTNPFGIDAIRSCYKPVTNKSVVACSCVSTCLVTKCRNLCSCNSCVSSLVANSGVV